jgi:hypothetical protein
MGRKIGTKSPSSATTGSASNGGILGSGVFGMFGTMIQCNAEDSSLYCNFMKIFNVMIVVIIIIAIFSALYAVISARGKQRRG